MRSLRYGLVGDGMIYGCIGEKLGHSFSADIHAMLASKPYELRELRPDEIGNFLTERRFCGINVTIPYKQIVIPYLDEIDGTAKKIGAVNTIVNRDGKLYGYNTDFDGLSALLHAIGANLNGKTVAILGTGGTSLTALAVAESQNAKRIIRVSRHEGENLVTYETFYKEFAKDVQILINTTPVGMFPKTDGCPIDLDRLPNLEAVADPVYNPLRTNLIFNAKQRNIPASGGLLMLTAQAVRASEIFTGVNYPSGTAEKICAVLTERKENIVLSGMPGSGKSTVGKLLAEKTGRKFLDLDDEITKADGRTPAEIIRAEGEETFRRIETDVLKNILSGLTFAVLALGGGTVLRDENIRLLKQNGKIYFLDRPLSELLPTADRPLSSTKEAVGRRYRERIDRYNATGDFKISTFPTPSDAVKIIERDRNL